MGRPRQACVLYLLDDLGIDRRRSRQVIEAISFQLTLSIEFLKTGRELLKSRRAIVIPGDVDKGLRKTMQSIVISGTRAVALAHRFGRGLLKFGIRHFTARKPNYGKTARQ